MKFKQMMSVFLALCLILAMLPGAALAAEMDVTGTNADAQVAKPEEVWGGGCG